MKAFRNTFLLLIGIIAFFAFNAHPDASADATGSKIADISQYQGNINWAKASTDLKYVIIRIQHGTQFYDTKAKYNQQQAQRYGVPFGVYAYSNFTSKADAVREAQTLYARSNKATNFFVLDDEQRRGGSSSEVTYAKTWLKTMKSLTNKPLILYSGESFTKTYGLQAAPFHGYWIANYTYKPAIKTDLWQFTSKGKVNGIQGSVDLNKAVNPDKVASWFTHSDDDDED